MSKIIGIDLGTTNSCVSVMESGAPVVIVNQEGSRTTPSIIAFNDKGERLVGASAKRQMVVNAENTVNSIKRFMGKRHSELSDESDNISYKVVKGKGDLVKVNIMGKDYTPQELSAAILSKLKKAAEDYLGHDVSDAVITVPAYFNDNQRQATKEAGEIAGLNVMRIINEPTAAALAYGIDDKAEKNVIVFDCGGGTHDVSLLNLSDGLVEVLATNGDSQLGGDDFDNVVVDWMNDEFSKENGGFQLKADPMALQRLREAAEKAKIDLSSTPETEINLPFITAIDGVPKHLVIKLNRATFDKLSSDLVKRTIKPCRSVLKSAKMKVGDVDEIILVGGSTRIPAIREAVSKFFKKEVNHSVNPDEAVSLGAAIQGGILGGDVQDMVLLDVTPLTLGIETMGGIMSKLIESNTTIPIKKSEIYSTATDNQPSVEIHVLQGERPMANDNKSLGRFNLTGIPPAQRGTPRIEVTFDIDANGILSVTAKDLGTNTEQSIRIEGSTGLSDEEIKQMREDAEKFADEDAAKEKLVTTSNKAQGFVDAVRASIDTTELEESDKEDITKMCDELLETVKGQDIDEIEAAYGELEAKWNELIRTFYENQQANADPNADEVDATEVEDE